MESSNGAVRTIGRMARESGLSVSALRFYDGAGVLAPASVDPGSGYRYYTPDQLPRARLIARLRQLGLPLARIARSASRLSAANPVESIRPLRQSTFLAGTSRS